MYCHNCGRSNPKNSKFCQRCGINFSAIAKTLRTMDTAPKRTIRKNSKEPLTPNEEPYPYVISNKKLITLFVLTGSIYQVIWFYKHFKSFKHELGWKNNPVLRAIFSDFVAYSLFRRVDAANQELGNKTKLYPGILAFIFFAMMITTFLPSFFAFLYFFCVIVLARVQSVINEYWNTKYPKRVESSPFGTKNLVWSIIGGFGWIITILFMLYATYGMDKNGNDTFFKSLGITEEAAVEVETVEASNENSDWTVFTEEIKGFSQSFPTEPEYSIDNSSDFPYETWSNSIDTRFYCVGYVKYDDSVDTSNTAVFLNEMLHAIVAGDSRNELLFSKNKIINGVQVKEFAIKQDDTITQGILVLKGDVLFDVTVSYYESEGLPADYNTFIESFKAL